MIAALYVEKGGVYYGLKDVDPWDEERDAQMYDGPWPVVAHPPCARWSIMGNCRPEHVKGDDGGCFAAALDAVREFGGVLEHPRHSLAWREFGLPRPATGGWAQSFSDDGWTTEVDQAEYGHPARKLTWLYYRGPEPPALRWGGGSMRAMRTADNGGGGHDTRSRTPPAFRDVLLDMARSALVQSSR